MAWLGPAVHVFALSFLLSLRHRRRGAHELDMAEALSAAEDVTPVATVPSFRW